MNILNQAQALRTIALINSAGKKMDERIHLVGVSGIVHYAEHGDLTTLSALCRAMPESSRGNALKYWVTKHANVQWNKKSDGGKGGFQKIKKDEDRVVSIDDATEHPFWEKTDTEKRDFNAETRVKSFVNAFHKALKEGKITQEDWKKAKDAVLAA